MTELAGIILYDIEEISDFLGCSRFTIILSTIFAILLVNVIANDLLSNGLSGFFTIQSYKEAFELCEVDIVIINMLRWVLTGIALVIGYAYLSYNAELMRLERAERIELRKVVMSDDEENCRCFC